MEESQIGTTERQAARIYELWDKYLREGDMDGMAAIYADDATLQSPLVPTFFGPGKAMARGKEEILLFLNETVKRRPNAHVHWHRGGYLWNGKTLVWEYPAETPYGRFQVDLAECIDLEGGLIKRHRIYWGWYAVEMMKESFVRKVQEGRLGEDLLSAPGKRMP
jgi:hypothetical protein